MAHATSAETAIGSARQQDRATVRRRQNRPGPPAGPDPGGTVRRRRCRTRCGLRCGDFRLRGARQLRSSVRLLRRRARGLAVGDGVAGVTPFSPRSLARCPLHERCQWPSGGSARLLVRLERLVPVVRGFQSRREEPQSGDALRGSCVVSVGACGGAAQPAGPSLPGQGRLRRRCAMAQAPPWTCEPPRPLRAALRAGQRRRVAGGNFTPRLLGGQRPALHNARHRRRPRDFERQDSCGVSAGHHIHGERVLDHESPPTETSVEPAAPGRIRSPHPPT